MLSRSRSDEEAHASVRLLSGAALIGLRLVAAGKVVPDHAGAAHVLDLAARVGGEEFAVVLEGQDLAEAMRRAEKFRSDLFGHPIALEGVTLPMTASIGVAAFDARLHPDDDALYHAADSAVYRAKAEGRNRVCVEGPATVLAEAG